MHLFRYLVNSSWLLPPREAVRKIHQNIMSLYATTIWF